MDKNKETTSKSKVNKESESKVTKKSKVDTIVEKLKDREKYTYKEMVDFVTEQKLTPEELNSVYKRLEELGINLSEDTSSKQEESSAKTEATSVQTSEVQLPEGIAELEIEPNLEDISDIEKDILLDDVNDF